MFYSYRYCHIVHAVELAQKLINKRLTRRRVVEISRDFPAQVHYTFGWDTYDKFCIHERRSTRADVRILRANDSFSMFVNGKHLHVQALDETVRRLAVWLLLTRVEMEGLRYSIDLLSGKVPKPAGAQLIFLFFQGKDYISGNMNGFIQRGKDEKTEVIPKEELQSRMEKALLEKEDLLHWLEIAPSLPTFGEQLQLRFKAFIQRF